MEEYRSQLFSVLKGYKREQFVKDLMAGIIVAIIALPLSIAFALGCGVSAEKGIYAAIISSITVALLGGSRVQIAGPTGAFIIITQTIIEKYGMSGLMVATIMAGIMLVIMGVLKLGRLIKYIPSPITTGFTGGIAVTIFTLEVKDFLGLQIDKMPSNFFSKWMMYLKELNSINVQALLLGVFCVTILVIWPKINEKSPNSLIAIVVGTAISYFGKLEVKTLGEISKTLSMPVLPNLNLDSFFDLMPSAFTISILVAMQALLSAVVTDGMIRSKHKASAELVAQGIANVILGIFGCIPATGGVARSIANAKNGARTPIAAIVHGITLFVFLIFAMPLLRLVPLCVLAAILIVVAVKMFNFEAFWKYRKAPHSDTMVLLASCFLTFAFDLVLAIEVGMVMAGALFMKRMADETHVKSWTYIEEDAENIRFKTVPKETLVYEINGPMFFGAADKFMNIVSEDYKKAKVIIVRMRSVPSIDATAMHTLERIAEMCEAEQVTLVFSHLLKQPLATMKKAGFYDDIGEENFCENIDAALKRAQEIIDQKIQKAE